MPQPQSAAQLEQAMQMHRAGDIGGAAQIYQQIIDRDPANADAWQLLGVIARQTGKKELARQLLETALQLNPRHAPALANHALLLREAGEAAAAQEQAEAALRADPSYAGAHDVLGGLCRDRRDFDGAIRHYRAALKRQPDNAELHNSLAAALHRAGQLPEAWRAVGQALRLAPESAHCYNTRGNILRAAGYPDLACEAFAEAARRDPALSDAVINEALCRLLIGDFARGWDLFAGRGKAAPRYADLPRWDGAPIMQGTLLLAAEQGLGDTLQFLRLAPWAAVRARRVVLEVQPPLQKLAAQSFPHMQVITPEQDVPAEAGHYCRLLDLPRLMQLAMDAPPGEAPWLIAEDLPPPAILAQVKHPRIGLVWGGNPDHLNDANRSLTLAQLRPTLQPFQAHILSLQKGVQVEELRSSAFALPDGGAGLTDFAATAALLRHLDLLITVDTSMAHLAGALGHPVWLLLPYDPDWRWLLERRDVPWYPSARLYRQPAPGDWRRVLAAVARDLAALAGGESLPPVAGSGGQVLRQTGGAPFAMA